MVAVIAVVLVLIVLLWPGCICTSRPRARKAACLSNLKQLGLAAAMYRQDYDDTLFWNPAPGGRVDRNKAGSPGSGECAPQPESSFVLMLLPYLKYTHVFHCPSYDGYDLDRHLGYRRSLTEAASPSRGDFNVSGGVDSTWIRKIGYGFNEVLIGNPCRPRKVASLGRAPEDIALLGEGESPWASSTGVWVREKGEWSRHWRWDPAREPRHEEGQNFVYVDGHARFLTPVAKDEAAREGYYPAAKLE
jgi:prepilin-type processing-associated H-X9-DG protein